MNKKKKFLLLLASKKSDLPAGYAALEYLEGSGTQWLNTRLYLHGNSRVAFEAMPLERKYTNYFFDVAKNGVSNGKFGISFGLNGGYSNALFYQYGNEARYCRAFADGSSSTLALGQNYHFEMYDGVLYKNGAAVTTSYNSTIPIPVQEFTSALPCYLFASQGNSDIVSINIMRMYSFSVKENDALLLKLVPALRKSDAVPGMWDTVSKQFFTNAGSGTFGYRIKTTGDVVAPMARRDPYRVAPSGVYARKVSETGLEIIADTEEASGDGWEWFANTADAMEHFGIITSEQI